MRGKVKGKRSPFSIFGITPAYAGKRFLLKESFDLWKDHPRLCGEKVRSTV